MSEDLDLTKTLDAKVQIHRLTKIYRELADIPYKSQEEQEKETELITQIRSITKGVIFKNEVDQDDFKGFMDDLLDEIDFELQEPEGTKIHDEQLTDELDQTTPLGKNQAIPQIQAIQQKKQTVEEEIAQLQKMKKDMLLVRKKDNLKKEVEKMQDKIREDQKEENFLTDKKDKDGLVKLRSLKYNMRMDEHKLERIQLEQMLEKSKDPEEILTLKEAIKINKGKVSKLRQLKIQTYVQNAMIKIPKWIAKGSKSINEISGSLGGVGGNQGKSNGGDFSNMQVGGGDDNPFGGEGQSNPFGGDNPFGKGGDNPFDLSAFTGSRSSKTTSKPKKKRKKSKPKKKGGKKK